MHLARSVLDSTELSYSTSPHSHHTARPARSPSSPRATQYRSEARSPTPALPPIQTTLGLVDIFLSRYSVQYPILSEDEFKADITRVYEDHSSKDTKDPCSLFMLYLVLSIALAYTSRTNPETMRQAEAYGASAMAQLGTILRPKNHRSLQCLLLLLLSATLNLTSAPIWHISGLCFRMVIDLGYHSERTIRFQGTGLATEIECDVKRRLFWTTYTFDRTLAIILGRPPNLEDEKIDVLLPGCSLPEAQRPMILHWFNLQRMQSEILHRLNSARTSNSLELAHFTTDILDKLEKWHRDTASVVHLGDFDTDWWSYWYYNTILILCRPSPTTTATRDQHSAESVLSSAKNMIHLSFIRINKSCADITCMELHSQLMSGITMLFLILRNPETRASAQKDWLAFKSCLVEWQCVMDRISDRWQSMTRTRDVLTRLADAAVDVIERDMGRSKRSDFWTPTVNPSQLGPVLSQQAAPHSHGQGSTAILPVDRGNVAYDDRFSGAQYGEDYARTRPFGCDQPQANHLNPVNSGGGITSELDLAMIFNHGPDTNLVENPDLSSILGIDSQVWPGFTPLGDSQLADLDIWDYLQLPAVTSDAIGLESFDRTSADGGPFADLILNFHDSTDDTAVGEFGTAPHLWDFSNFGV